MILIPLGRQLIQRGKDGDPQRIKKMVGKFTHYLDPNLDPDRFADKGEEIRKGRGIANWGEEEKEVELFAARLERVVPDYNGLLHELTQLPPDYSDLQKASFPHLSTQFSDEKLGRLWKEGIYWLNAPDESALWRDDDGRLYVPCAGWRPGDRGLNADWGGRGWVTVVASLLVRE